MFLTTNFIMQQQTPVPPELPAAQRMILKGLQDSLADTFKIPAASMVFFATTNKMKIAEYVRKMHEGVEGKLKWPVMLLHLNNVGAGTSEAMHGYNTRSMARHGTYLRMSEQATSVVKAALVPIVMEFEVIYLTDSFEQAFAYSTGWVVNGVQNRLNFTLTYGNVGIDIRCELSPSMSTPDREEAVDQPNVFEYVSTLRVAGYATDDHPDGTSAIQVVSKPVLNVSIEDRPEADRRVWSPGHQSKLIKERKGNKP